jgi:hypothetical protein
MCALCVEIQLDRIKFGEIKKALGEFVIPPEHKEEFFQLIEDKLGPEYVWALEPVLDEE